MHLHSRCLLGLVVASFAAHAQTSYTWSGGATGAWETATNWTPNGVPGGSAGDSANLNAATSVTLSAAPAQALAGLSIQGGAKLTLLGAAWALDVTAGTGVVSVGGAS